MRVKLVDNVYDAMLDADQNDSLFGLKLAPALQFSFGVVGIDVKSSKEDLFEIVESSRNLSTFESLLREYDVEYTLKNKEDITVLAPTNMAFKNVNATLEQLDKAAIEDILLSHILETKIKADDLEDGMTVQTMGSLELTVEEDDDEFYFVAPGIKSKVKTSDIKGNNGYIHTLDEVLIPKINVVSLVSGNILLEKLTELLTSNNLVTTLTNMESVTVLAPYDSAFNAIETTLVGLSASDVNDVLLSHVIDSEYLAKDLDDDMEIETLGSMKLTVEKKDGKVYFKAPGSKAEVKVADIEGDNGVVHLIDTVLLP